MLVEFIKISGSGNDFVIFDNRNSILSDFDHSELAKFICRRGISVGADGIILLEKSDDADVRMNYFNADGSSAEMCGNGARCVAAFFAALTGNNSPRIQTGAGIIRTEVNNDIVTVQMPVGKLIQANIELLIDELPMLFDWYNTGVPHAVIIVDSLDEIPVDFWGREIRYNNYFQPDGTNVDFVHIIDEHNIAIRTYERGVEGETLSCGTGAVASAISAARKKLAKSPVSVKVALPDILTVNFDITEHGSADNIWFSGKVIYSFKGEIELPDNFSL